MEKDTDNTATTAGQPDARWLRLEYLRLAVEHCRVVPHDVMKTAKEFETFVEQGK